MEEFMDNKTEDYYLSIPLYHVDTIKNNKDFLTKHSFEQFHVKDDDWGGDGVYFWDNIGNAKYWLTGHWKNDKEQASIVQVELQVNINDILDLSEPIIVSEFEGTVNKMINWAQNQKDPFLKAQAHKIWTSKHKGEIINFYANLLQRMNEDVFKVTKIIGLYPNAAETEFFQVKQDHM